MTTGAGRSVTGSAVDPAELQHFKDTFLYREEAFLVDEIVAIDREARRMEARFHTTRPLPYSALQRVSPQHPAHVSAAEMLMVTGSLGCLHAWLFHGCRWDEGWAGFGNRIHRADFKRIARIGPPLRLVSEETRTRVGAKRVVLRYDFHFYQEALPEDAPGSEQLVYVGDQSAMFVKGVGL